MQERYRFHELEKFSSEVLNLILPLMIDRDNGKNDTLIEYLKNSSVKRKLRVIIKNAQKNEIAPILKEAIFTYGVVSMWEEDSMDIPETAISTHIWKIIYETVKAVQEEEKTD